jgi:type I restriction enzyme S subunit
MKQAHFPLVPFERLVEINPTIQLGRAGDHPFVAMEDVTPGRRCVRSRQRRGLAGGAKFAPGDTLFARITPCLENGKIAQFDPSAACAAFGSTEFIVLRARPHLSVPAFIFYLSTTEWVRGPAIASMAGASGRQRARAEAVAGALVPDVPFPAQCRIASILGAYDDLIEVNLRRIALLEEMARRLFEEWFVHFRFPGHDGVSAVSGGADSVPRGWRPGVASDLVDFDPSTRLPRAGRKPFIPMASVGTTTSIIDGIEEREAGSGAKFQNGDTLFARITPCLENGKTGLVRHLPGDGVGFGSTEFIVMRGATAGPAFTYCLARHEPFRAHAQRSMSGATGRQRARTESVKLFELAVPPRDLLDRFEATASPMLDLVGRLGSANQRLAASRDLLLPRLISGELPITAAERDLEVAA